MIKTFRPFPLPFSYIISMHVFVLVYYIILWFLKFTLFSQWCFWDETPVHFNCCLYFSTTNEPQITFFHLSTCRKFSCVQYFTIRNSLREPYTGSSMIEWHGNQVANITEEGHTLQEGGLGIVWHLGSWTWLEFSGGNGEKWEWTGK